jgi:nucleoside-diphosphate-sugar epimerase
MRTLLLTGATGFVGRNLVLRELSLGTRIFAPVRDPEKLRRQLEAEGLDPSAVTPLSPDPRSWESIHPTHAVLSAGVLFARNRDEYFRVNVDWTLHVLGSLPKGCQTILLSSQSAGGPTPRGKHARSEKDADVPLTWYGQSKGELERAARKAFPERNITILRPPMILGARDTAILPLFKMASGLIRTKPGLRKKTFSFIAVEDVIEAIHTAWESSPTGSYYIAADHTISDFDLIHTAAEAAGARGITLPVPLALVKAMSFIIDSVPALRATAPSLTRDRAREIWPDRWVVDSSAFRHATGWRPTRDLKHALHTAHDSFVKQGDLPPRKHPKIKSKK